MEEIFGHDKNQNSEETISLMRTKNRPPADADMGNGIGSFSVGVYGVPKTVLLCHDTHPIIHINENNVREVY